MWPHDFGNTYTLSDNITQWLNEWVTTLLLLLSLSVFPNTIPEDMDPVGPALGVVLELRQHILSTGQCPMILWFMMHKFDPHVE